MTLPPHFWSKVDKAGPVSDYAPHLGPCWLWTATCTAGYGRFGSASNASYPLYETTLAYHIAWVDVNGPVPEGLELDHLCNTPPCVRPDHLEPVTHLENMRRRFARRTACPNGHPITPELRVPHYNVEIGDRCLTCRRTANRESIRRQRARRVPIGQAVPWEVRQWARENGIAVGNRGRLADSLIEAYVASAQASA